MSDLNNAFKTALSAAQTSPCIRRKYAALIIYEESPSRYVIGVNWRQSECCAGNTCRRETLGLVNGERVEVGAEIHAETAALIRAPLLRAGTIPLVLDDSETLPPKFILAGYGPTGKELFGPSVYPCHTCAMNIKFAGFKYIHIHEKYKNDITIRKIHIEEILQYREEEWNLA